MKNHNYNNILIFIVILILLSACAIAPKGVEPISGFELDRYLGKWYEIARLDHSFERGLSRVTAEYSLRDDGGVKVINRGYNQIKTNGKKRLERPTLLKNHTLDN